MDVVTEPDTDGARTAHVFSHEGLDEETTIIMSNKARAAIELPRSEDSPSDRR
jgi:hypothetical protein